MINFGSNFRKANDLINGSHKNVCLLKAEWISFLALGEVVSEGGWFGNNSIVFPFTRYLHSILINLFL